MAPIMNWIAKKSSRITPPPQGMISISFVVASHERLLSRGTLQKTQMGTSSMFFNSRSKELSFGNKPTSFLGSRRGHYSKPVFNEESASVKGATGNDSRCYLQSWTSKREPENLEIQGAMLNSTPPCQIYRSKKSLEVVADAMASNGNAAS
ncbi:hypothetical protein Ancab_034255 [Ancistrocladus abbreviatus]